MDEETPPELFPFTKRGWLLGPAKNKSGHLNVSGGPKYPFNQDPYGDLKITQQISMIHQFIKTCENCFRSTPIYNSFLSIHIMYSISIISTYTIRKANMTMEKNQPFEDEFSYYKITIFQAVMFVFILDIIYIYIFIYT